MFEMNMFDFRRDDVGQSFGSDKKKHRLPVFRNLGYCKSLNEFVNRLKTTRPASFGEKKNK
jgi:hypothetical protein